MLICELSIRLNDLCSEASARVPLMMVHLPPFSALHWIHQPAVECEAIMHWDGCLHWPQDLPLGPLQEPDGGRVHSNVGSAKTYMKVKISYLVLPIIIIWIPVGRVWNPFQNTLNPLPLNFQFHEYCLLHLVPVWSTYPTVHFAGSWMNTSQMHLAWWAGTSV